jgi:hypothetical protein
MGKKAALVRFSKRKAKLVLNFTLYFFNLKYLYKL